MGFAEYEQKLAGAVTWLAGPNMQQFVGFLGTQKQTELTLLIEGVKARFPASAPTDALYYVGRDRDLERHDGETDEVYSSRIEGAWDTWPWAGTPTGVENSLTAFGLPVVLIRRDYDWHGAPGEWYSRFWVVVGAGMASLYSGAPWGEPWGFLWGLDDPVGPSVMLAPLTMPYTQGDTVTLGSTATVAQVGSIKRQILKWKAAHGYPVKVILAFDGEALQGINTVMPFTMPADGNLQCTWRLARLQNDETIMPFTQGGYEV